MKKFFALWIFVCLTAAASAADMQFVTVLSQPVGSFSRLSTTSSAPVYAEQVVVGSNVTFQLKGNVLIQAVKASNVSVNTKDYKLKTLNLNAGELDARNTKVSVNSWTSSSSVTVKSDSGELKVVGEGITTQNAGFGTLNLNGSAFFNGTLANNATSFGWSADYAPSGSGSLLLQK